MALAGIGLMMLARGVLRGQRRAWLVATVLLAASLVLHLLHGASVGGLVVSGVVLALLVAERDLFGAAPTTSRPARPPPPWWLAWWPRWRRPRRRSR